jgi:hypothetical protein
LGAEEAFKGSRNDLWSCHDVWRDARGTGS